MSIEVNVEGLLGGLQHQMAIRATVKVPCNHSRYTWRETPFQVFTNQTDGLSARHGGPQINLPPINSEHDALQFAAQTSLFRTPLKSTIYERVNGGLTIEGRAQAGTFCPIASFRHSRPSSNGPYYGGMNRNRG